VLIVSGLAYGIDICAHRNALANGFETVGVLAHGLDDLYPARHKETARRMVTQGGLLTEYTTQTQPLPQNFIQRNRIVAGMSDACILVESAKKGGGLITAGIARSYNRDVFAFPGPVGAAASEGCNNLIRDNGAALITSARDLVLAMGWQAEAQVRQAKAQGIERDMFPQLTDEERCIVDVLQQNNDLQMNILVVKTGIPVASLTAILFEMEMKGIVKTMAGGVYHLLTI
jgi:DNA processing protein